MKLSELFENESLEDFVSDTMFKKLKQKDKDLKRSPSPEGEGNRLSPLTIPIEDPKFCRAIGPLGGLRKDGSKK